MKDGFGRDFPLIASGILFALGLLMSGASLGLLDSATRLAAWGL
jgi:hypothetical protein